MYEVNIRQVYTNCTHMQNFKKKIWSVHKFKISLFINSKIKIAIILKNMLEWDVHNKII